MRKRNIILRYLGIVLLVVVGILAFLSITGTVAHAAGLVDDTVDAANEYSKYPLENYQLDFYVDSSWDWLPWNWLDGIGKSIQYGLYAITNFVWTVSMYISNATGYVVQEAYKLDFISDTADAIGKNIQTLAGVTENGFSAQGFYVGFLLILILVVGIYVAYVGLLKRETTKAVHAVLNFLVVFLLSASFIAYAPNYIAKINDFSSDISSAALTLGTKITLPDSSSQGKDSVDLIRDSLFSIQVKQPWLLLQYDTTDVDSLGADRVGSLLSASPDTDERENIVIEEIEDRDNDNMSITKTMSRLGTVVFLFIFNIGISVFVFLLTGMMIFSQVLFIIYAMFLPVSFILSMIPTYEGMGKRAVTKLFNTIMLRAGITLIITAAFSVSTMFYSISAGYPFFMIAFLQIVTFAGIYFKMGDLMSMFSLQSNDTQQVGRRILRRPYLFLNRGARRLERRIGRTLTTGAAGGVVGAAAASGSKSDTKRAASRPNHSTGQNPGTFSGKRAASAVGDTEEKQRGGDTSRKSQAGKAQDRKNLSQSGYAASTEQTTKLSGVQRDVIENRYARRHDRSNRQENRRPSIAQRRMEIEKAKQAGSAAKAAPVHERPAVSRENISKYPTSKEPVTKTQEIRTQVKNEPVSHAPGIKNTALPEQKNQSISENKEIRQTSTKRSVQKNIERNTVKKTTTKKGRKQ